MKNRQSPINHALIMAGVYGLLCAGDYFIFGNAPSPRGVKIMGVVIVLSTAMVWLLARVTRDADKPEVVKD